MSINGQPTEGTRLLGFDRDVFNGDDDRSMSRPVRIFCSCLALLELGAVGYIAAAPPAPDDPGYYHKVGCRTAAPTKYAAASSRSHAPCNPLH